MIDALTYARMRVHSVAVNECQAVIEEAQRQDADPEIIKAILAMHTGLSLKLSEIMEEMNSQVIDIDANNLKGKSEEQIRKAILDALPAGMKLNAIQ